jgi:hypothetical protein
VQRRLFEASEEVEHDWLAYNGDFKDRGNFVRYAAEPFGDGKLAGHEGDVSLARGGAGEELQRKWRARRGRFVGTSDPAHPFRYQGSADLNTYKMFVEVGHALLRTGGQVGMVVPSGLYTDKGTGELRELLLDRCAWRWLYGFENRTKIFDIDSRFKFCVCIAEKGGFTDAIQAAFMRHDLEDWAGAVGVLSYPAERVKGFSPKSLSVLEIRSEQDLRVLEKMTSGVDVGSVGDTDGWRPTYGTDFHMTSDSPVFVDRERAAADGYALCSDGHWRSRSGSEFLPLVQGVMFYVDAPLVARHVAGHGHQAKWEESREPCATVVPQYLVPAAKYRPPSGAGKLVYRALSNATNERTMIAAALPAGFPVGHSVNIIRNVEPASGMAVLNSLAYDWGLRLRIAGTNLTTNFIDESAVPSLPGAPVRAIAARLLAVGPWMSAVACDAAKGWDRTARAAITAHERLRLRCMLDAILAVLYGLDRDDFAWILRDCDHPASRLADKAFCRTLDPKGFWRVDKAQEPELRHTVLSLVALDDLQRAIAAAGSRDAGIQAFCDQHDGDGWMLPETLCLSDLGLTRSVDVGTYDDHARTPQPVRARMGERFLDWQLAQTPEESWAECERHAKAILEGTPAPPTPAPPSPPAARPPGPDLGPLFRPR